MAKCKEKLDKAALKVTFRKENEKVKDKVGVALKNFVSFVFRKAKKKCVLFVSRLVVHCAWL